MSPKSFLLSEQLQSYLVEHSVPLDDVQRSLIAETDALGDVRSMQIAPEQGAFLTVLTGALGVRNAVEVGTFTGYSALCIARGLSDGGHLLCCDVSEEWTAIARRHWDVAGVADRIELRLAPAAETLRSLPDTATIDLAFLDADKRGYRDYAEQLIRRLRPGGVLLVDNVLWHGTVIDADADADADSDAAHIRAFNEWLAANQEVDSVMLPIADGVTLSRKR
jgi:caffeoyl-CoA O-methyltransferase